ncbi:Adaptor for signal transduction [Tulasnella sp. 419]|nr:Adaptor for signal transduction [Tulasnella sp. 419]
MGPQILLPGTKPYERYSRVNQILYAIKLNHPPFEDGYREVDVDKRCWDIVQSCWSAADKRPGINKVYSDIKDFVVGIVHPDVLGRELTRIAEEKDFETGLSMGIRHADHHWEVIQNTCKSLHLPEPEEWNCFTLFLQYEDNCTNYTMTEEVKRETGEPPFLTFYRLQREGRKPRFSIEFDPKHRTELPKKKGVSYMKIFKTLFPQLDPEQWRLLIEYKGGETYLSSSSNPQRQFRKLREEGKGPYFAVRLLSKLRSPVYEQTRLGRDAAIQATYLNQPGKIFQPRDRYAVAYLPKIAEDGQGDILIGTGFQVVSDDPFKYRCRFIEKNEKGEISMSRRIDLDYKTVVLLQLPPSIAVLETQKRLDRTGRWAQIDSSTLARARSLKSYEPILLEYFIDPLGWWAYAVDSYQPQNDYELELFRDEGVRLLRTQKAWSYVAKLNGGKHGWVPSWVLEIDEEKEKNVRWM